jgi:hypothetical protein
MAPRHTRSQKDSAPPASTSPASIRPTGLRRAAPTTNDDKQRLLDTFNQAYESFEVAKNDLVAARGKTVGKACLAFGTNLVSGSDSSGCR